MRSSAPMTIIFRSRFVRVVLGSGRFLPDGLLCATRILLSKRSTSIPQSRSRVTAATMPNRGRKHLQFGPAAHTMTPLTKPIERNRRTKAAIRSLQASPRVPHGRDASRSGFNAAFRLIAVVTIVWERAKYHGGSGGELRPDTRQGGDYGR